MYLQQTVYYQHETVHSVPALSKRFTDPLEVTGEKDSYANARQVSQSCCFLSAEEKSASDETHSRDRLKERRRAIDSVTTLANLIDALETLKIQTYKKLKEIESINQEIRGMRASCENIEEKHWLHHAEKIMSRQKRFTIRSSQCCFSELKKLAKECNFDKLLDDSVISEAEDGKTLLMKKTDAPLSCSNASGDKLEFGGWETIAGKLSVSNSERFSRKAQKLIRSFFEDIKESEETQLNVEKSLLLKKFEKLSKRKSTLLNTSSLNFPQGQMLITKKMMNLGQIRKQFFTEIAVDEKTVAPMETKMVPAGKKKKNKGFFKVSLSGFDSDKKSTAKKATKRSFFTKSALAWINNRINTLHDTSPVIPLRITDIELKTGSIITKNKSKQSVKTTSIRKLVSDERARTEMSGYLSESIISGFSDKQSRYSKQNRAQRSIIQGVENNIDTNGELSIVRVVEDLDTNSFFVRLSNSANISSGTSIDSDRRKGRKSRKDLWEDCSSTMSEYQRDLAGKREVHYKRTEHVQCRNSLTRHIVQRILSTSSESSIVIGQQSKREMLTLISNKTTKKEMVSSRDVSIGATENFSEDSPRKKRMKLESMTSSLDVDEVRYTEPECQKVTYTENECQVDIMPTAPAFETTAVQCQETDIQDVNVGKFEVTTRKELQNIVLESKAETENDSSESRCRVTLLDTPAEVHVTLPVLVENQAGEDESKTVEDNVAESGTPAVSVSPEKSQDKTTEPDKDLPTTCQGLVDVKDLLAPENKEPRESIQAPEDAAILGSETNAVSDKLMPDAKNAIHRETHKNDKPAETVYNLPSIQNFTDEDSPRHDIHCENFSHLLSDEQSEKKMKILGDGVEDSEYNNEKRPRSAVSLSREVSQDMSKDIYRFMSEEVSQHELSECNDYDLQTDSNGTMHYDQQQCLPSGETTPSTPSSDNEKQEELSIATGSSLFRINSQRKQFSTESFNICKSSNEGKHKKRRSCVKKKSKHLVKRNNSVIMRLNRVGSNILDFTNLTEEEQLKIISANVASFVKQKLVEHKQFFDFEKNDPMVFGMEHWSKMEEDDANVLSGTIGEAEGNVFDLEKESSPPLESMLRTELEQQAAPVDKPAPAEPTPQDEAAAVPVPDPAAEQPISQTEEKAKKESESPPNNPEVTQNRTANEIQGAKADSNKQSMDFIKLNKMMVSKYKRAGPEADKGAAGKKTVKKEANKEAAKPSAKPTSAQKDTLPPLQSGNVPSENQEPESNSKPDNHKTAFTPRRGIRAPSADSAKGITRGMKSDIPVLQHREHSTSPRRVGRVNVRSVSASPATAKTVSQPRKIPSPSLAPAKKVLPKKRLIPTYTLTSCLTAPNELIRYQQWELDKYLNQRGDITNFLEKSTERPRRKNRNALSKKNLDYLIMLQKRINHEISENIENSMNYVKTLLSQDYNGTAIIEKAPVKNSLDDFEAQNGILLIEMNDRMDSSSSSSELSNESGFYCLYRSNDTWEKTNSKPDIIVKRNESGDSGMVGDLQNMDSSYDCEVSIIVNPGNESSQQKKKHCTSNVLKKYIYHLGGGEESSDIEVTEASWNPKPKQKRRKERVLDIPQKMKRKLLDILADEMKHPPPAEGPSSSSSSSSSSAVPEECLESKEENFDLDNSEIIYKISKVVLQYLDQQDWKHSPEDGEARDTYSGTDHDKKLPDTESR